MSAGRLASAATWASFSHLTRSVSFALSNGATVLFGQLPLLFVAIVEPAETLGGYGFAHRLALAANILPQAVAVAFFPRMVKAYERGEVTRLPSELAVLSVALSVGVSSVVAVAISSLGLIDLIFPMAEPMALVLLASFVVLRGAREAGMRTLFSQRDERAATIIAGSITVAALGLYVALVLTGNLSQLSATLTLVLLELIAAPALYFRYRSIKAKDSV